MNRAEPAGAGFAIGALAGLVWAVPIAARLDAPSLAVRYVLIAAACILIAGPLVFALRARPARSRSFETAVAFASALSAAPLAVIGSVLKSQTHHRQLGGVTFALMAVLFVAILSLLVARSLEKARGAGHEKKAQVLLLVLGAASLGFAILRLLRGAEPFAVGLVIEAATGIVVLGAAAKLPLRPPASVARVGVGLWVAVAVAGVAGGRLLPEATTLLSSGAPLTYGLTISPQK